MLFRLTDNFKLKSDKYSVPMKGVVVDNEDPKKLGRVKCQIEGLFDGIPKEKLPYIYPEESTALGGGENISKTMIPNIGAELKIIAPFKNPYSLFYSGYWRSTKTKQTRYDEDYPNSYGFEDETGNYYKVNRKSGKAEFQHSSGTKIYIYKNGDIEIEGVNDCQILIKGNCNAEIDKDLTALVKGDTSFTCEKNVTGSANGYVKLSAQEEFEINSNVKISLNAPIIDFSAWGSATIGRFFGIFRHEGEHIHTGNKTHTGNVIQSGNYNLGGILTAIDAIISGITFSTHKHTHVRTGTDNTGTPTN